MRDLRDQIEDPDTSPEQRTIGAQALDELHVDEPERDQAIDLCIRAWRELDTCRAIGMAVGPIPVTSIYTWCEFHSHEVDRDAAMMITHVILQLDSERSEREARKRALDEFARGKR